MSHDTTPGLIAHAILAADLGDPRFWDAEVYATAFAGTLDWSTDAQVADTIADLFPDLGITAADTDTIAAVRREYASQYPAAFVEVVADRATGLEGGLAAHHEWYEGSEALYNRFAAGGAL